MLCVLAGTQVDGGAVGEGEYGGVVGGLMNEVGLCSEDVFFRLGLEQGCLNTCGLSQLTSQVCSVMNELMEVD